MSGESTHFIYRMADACVINDTVNVELKEYIQLHQAWGFELCPPTRSPPVARSVGGAYLFTRLSSDHDVSRTLVPSQGNASLPTEDSKPFRNRAKDLKFSGVWRSSMPSISVRQMMLDSVQ